MGIREEMRIEWKRRILAQRASGKSAFAWCQDNDVTYHAFLKQSKQFDNPAEDRPLDPLHFQELKNQPSDPMIEIIYKGSTIRISHSIDKQSLKECLQILWSTTC